MNNTATLLSKVSALMSTTFYDLTVPNYLQILNAVAGILEKGKSHFDAQSTDLSDMVDTRLIEDMNPFRFQVISVVHHSLGAVKAYETGSFAPPSGYGEPDYAELQTLVQDAIGQIEALAPDTVNPWEDGQVIFKLGGNELPFTVPNFAQTFSMPNFYFHATTTYSLLRMKGVPLGKIDFIGSLRMGV